MSQSPRPRSRFRPRFRARLRRLGFGLSTVLGLKSRGFFIPYRYADRLPDSLPPYGPVEAHLARPTVRQRLAGWLDRIDGLAEDLQAIGGDPPEPRWAQGWFCPLDAAMAYTLVRTAKPARIVEIGSGHSTRFLARAIADGGLATALTAIDPAPRADILSLPIRHIAATVQEAPAAAFAGLTAGDVLFIDSSHLALEGSDVDFIAGRIVPRLPAGVLVHVHDVCLPDPYFPDWRWRGYNEQMVPLAWIAGGGFSVQFASHYVATRMGDRLAASIVARLPVIAEARNTSLWLEKTSPAIDRV
jgi:hypothetical protein